MDFTLPVIKPVKSNALPVNNVVVKQNQPEIVASRDTPNISVFPQVSSDFRGIMSVAR